MSDHNSMLYWYPKIEGRVSTPKTVVIRVPAKANTMKWVDSGAPQEFLDKVKSANIFGYPVFMRTETLSDKHEWSRSCFVQSEDVLAQHLYTLIEMQEMAVWSDIRAVILREFLHLRAYFTAYAGMPVAREFRFFATKGRIDCYHPYWPHGAIEEGRPSISNWRDYLPQLEAEPDVEAKAIVECASKLFPEQMSLDVCQLEDGRWMLTDMALGEDSYHWKHGSADGGTDEDQEPKPPPVHEVERVETP